MKTKICFFALAFFLLANQPFAATGTLDSRASTPSSDDGIKYEYIPNSALRLSNFGVGDFNMSVEHKAFKRNNAKLSFKNSVRNGKQLSREDIMYDQDKIHGILKLNHSSIYDVVFFYDETPLEMLNYPRPTMNKRDEAATLTALRRNSTLAYSSAPRPYDFDDDFGDDEEEAEEEAAEEEEEDDDRASYDEDEDEDEYDRGMSSQRESDYSRSSASDIFGNTDEYLFWAGVGFAAIAVGTGVVGFLQNSKYSEANDAVEKAEKELKEFIGFGYGDNPPPESIVAKCQGNPDCEDTAYKAASMEPNDPRACAEGSNLTETCQYGGYIYRKEKNIKDNKSTRDGYNTGRIIFFTAAGLSAAVSITLFTW